MPIVVVCTQCGHRAGAKEEWAGKRLKCPACGNLVTVPSPTTAPPSTNAPAARSAPRAPAPPPQNLGQQAPGDLFGSGLGAGADPFAAAASAPMAQALGRPPVRSHKSSNSSTTVLIVLAMVGGVMLLGCAGVVAVLLPAVQRAREVARSRVAQGGDMPASLPQANLPAWTADPVLVAQLGDEVTFDRYSIKLPKGFALEPLPAAAAPPGGRLQQWGWAGPPSPLGDRHVVLAILVDMQGQRITGTLDQALAGFLQGVEKTAPTKVNSQTKGSLLGKQFVRVQYTMTPPNGMALHVLSYLGLEGNRMITVQSLCADAEGSEAYRLLEASLLTMREK